MSSAEKRVRLVIFSLGGMRVMNPRYIRWKHMALSGLCQYAGIVMAMQPLLLFLLRINPKNQYQIISWHDANASAPWGNGIFVWRGFGRLRQPCQTGWFGRKLAQWESNALTAFGVIRAIIAATAMVNFPHWDDHKMWADEQQILPVGGCPCLSADLTLLLTVPITLAGKLRLMLPVANTQCVVLCFWHV